MPPRTSTVEGASNNAGKLDNPIDPTIITGKPNGGNGNGDSGGTNGTVIRDSAGAEFDPDRHAHPDSRNKDGSFRGKRGRRSGNSGSKNRSQIYSDIEKSAEMLTKGLMIFHMSLAAVTKTPELMLDEEEAKGLSESGLTLLALYDIKPDPKIEAAILFAGQIGLIYGTRIVAIRARKAQEAKEKQPNTAGVWSSTGEPQGTTTFEASPTDPDMRVN